MTNKVTHQEVDDGREDIIFSINVEETGKSVNVCTIHQEYLDMIKIEGLERKEVAKAMSEVFLNILKSVANEMGVGDAE